jgi:hypothetical protein
MPANLSDGKVRVTALFGAGASRGWMDPKLNMVTNKGTICTITGEGPGGSGASIIGVSGNGVGRLTYVYPYQLEVQMSEATGNWSYPTGDGSVQFGHQGVFPSGVSQAAGTGMYYKEGIDTDANNGVFTFSR